MSEEFSFEDIRTLPKWTPDFPVPAWANPVKVEGQLIGFWNETNGEVKYVTGTLKKIEEWPEERMIRSMLNNLGGALFEQEFPGMTSKLFVRQAQAVTAGPPLSELELALVARYKYYSCN